MLTENRNDQHSSVLRILGNEMSVNSLITWDTLLNISELLFFRFQNEDAI